MISPNSIPLILHLFMLVFVPGINRGTFTFHPEDPFLLLAIAYCGWQTENRRVFMDRLAAPGTLAILFFFSSFAIWANLVNIFLSDYQEFLAMTIFRSVAFIYWLMMLCDLKKKLWDTILIFPFFGLLQEAIVFCQAGNYFAINDWLTPLYATTVESSIYSLLGLRSDGTYANPNDAAIGVAIFAMAALLCWRRTKTIWGGVFYALVAVSGLYCSVVYCKSRTGTAVLAAAFGFFLLSGFIQTRGRAKRAAAMAIVLLLGLVVGVTEEALSDASLRERFAVFTGEQKLTNEGSFAERMDMWRDGYALVEGNMVTGLGVTALTAYGWLDGGYPTYMFISGAIGCMILLCAHIALVAGPPAHRSFELYSMLALFALITVSHALVIRDKLWLPAIVLILFLRLEASERPAAGALAEETEREPDRENEALPEPQPVPAHALRAAE